MSVDYNRWVNAALINWANKVGGPPQAQIVSYPGNRHCLYRDGVKVLTVTVDVKEGR